MTAEKDETSRCCWITLPLYAKGYYIFLNTYAVLKTNLAKGYAIVHHIRAMYQITF